MSKLYVLGGRERRVLLTQDRPDWTWYESALVLQVDTESGAARICMEYKTPPEARASDRSICAAAYGRSARRLRPSRRRREGNGPLVRSVAGRRRAVTPPSIAAVSVGRGMFQAEPGRVGRRLPGAVGFH